MRESIRTRVEPSTQARESPQALSRKPHPKASKWLRNPSPRASFCGPAVLVEVPRSLPAVLRSRDLCPLLPLLSHEQCHLLLCQLLYNRDPYLPPYLPRPHLNQDPYRNPLQPSMGQQTTRDRRQHHEHLLRPHHLLPPLPHPRSLLSRHFTTLQASQPAN